MRQTKKAFILISHDRAFLRNLTRATLWVDRGKVHQNPKGFEAFEDWRDKKYDEEDQQRHKLNRLIKSEARWAVEGISARRKRNQGRVRRLLDLKDERSGQIKRQGAAAMEFADSPKSGKLVVDSGCPGVGQGRGTIPAIARSVVRASDPAHTQRRLTARTRVCGLWHLRPQNPTTCAGWWPAAHTSVW